MKRCTECDSVYPDTERFCELDGTLLIDTEPDTGVRVSDSRREMPRPGSDWKILAVLAVAGISLAVALFVIYYTMSRETTNENSSQSTSNSAAVVQQQSLPRPLQPSPVASVSPSVEPSPSPSVSPSPTPQISAEQLELSSNPISTGVETSKRGPVIIRLNDGLTIEADEAWQTSEGIWYRRRGIVTLLDPKQVKAIEKPSATPQPTPSQTPSP
jgi:hypothetical protein